MAIIEILAFLDASEKTPQEKGPLAGVTADIEDQVYWNPGSLDRDRVTTKPRGKKLLEPGPNDVAEELWPK